MLSLSIGGRELIWKKALHYFLAIVAISAMVYFFYVQFERNWSSLRDCRFSIDLFSLVASFVAMLVAFFMETYIWQVCVNHYVEKKLTFLESLSVFRPPTGVFAALLSRVRPYGDRPMASPRKPPRLLRVLLKKAHLCRCARPSSLRRAISTPRSSRLRSPCI